MGTWNATCGITQLPITEGERIVLIPLVIKPHDFLARDSLAGGGACAHDIIAQPFSVPLFGAYDSVGGIVLDEGQLGTACLLKVFEGMVERGRLMRTPSAKPVPVTEANIELLEEMMRRELIYQVKNPRKEWLAQLHETYASLAPDEKRGMDHYKPQMEVDINTLPDALDMGLGAMLVHEELYLALADKAGQDEAYGYWDDKKNELVEFKGTRRAELENFVTLAPEMKERVLTTSKELEAFYDQNPSDPSRTPEEIQRHRQRVLEIFVLASVQQASRISEDLLFFSSGANHALREAAFGDTTEGRDLWVNFILFSAAIISLRKLWTPQAGAGSSSGLGEFHELYKVQHEFVGKTLDAFYAERAKYEAEVAAREAARKAAKPKKPRASKKKSEAQS